MLKIINNPIDIVLNVIENEYKDYANSVKTIEFDILENESLYKVMINDESQFYVIINPYSPEGDLYNIEQIADIITMCFSNVISGEKFGEESNQIIYNNIRLKCRENYVRIESLNKHNESIECENTEVM